MRFLSLAALLAAPALGGEIRTFEAHGVRGLQGGAPFSGTLTIQPDATFDLERVFGAGARETVAGRARWEGQEFVLETAGGSRRYRRTTRDCRSEWVRQDGGDSETIAFAQNRECAPRTLLKALGNPGLFRWLAGNVDHIDPDPSARIVRSGEPQGSLIDWLAESYRLKTVVGLDGDANRLTRYVDTWGRDRFIRLHEHLKGLGIDYVRFGLQAISIPTDWELIAVFRILLDDSRKPILVHCVAGSDRTGLISALYRIEFLGIDKEQAKREMREHLWAASGGTEILGSYVDLYQRGELRRLLSAAGVPIPARFN